MAYSFFFIMVGIEGNARGIPRNKIKIPTKVAALTFFLAVVLFVIVGCIGVT